MVALGLLLGFLELEVLFRITGYGSPLSGHDLVLSWDPPAPYQAVPEGYRFIPGYSGVTRYRRATDGVILHEATVGIGASGLRAGPERPELLVVGDSVTFGLGVNADQAWPARLAAARGASVQVAAVPGWGIGDQSAWLHARGWELGASQVLFSFYLNDLMPGLNLARAGAGDVALRAPSWARSEAGLRRQSFLYNAVWRAAERRRILATLYGTGGSYLADLERHFHVPTLERHLLDLARGCAERRARCAVVVLPFFEDLPRPKAERLLSLVVEAATRAKVTVLRVDDSVDELTPAARMVLPGEQHPSPRAHQAIADAVAEQLERTAGW